MPRDYGELMAEAAADGFDSPEAAATARRQAREDAKNHDWDEGTHACGFSFHRCKSCGAEVDDAPGCPDPGPCKG